jgi:hypothetical protein
MDAKIPLIALGIGALWYFTRDADEFDDYDDYDDEAMTFEEGFDPSEYAFDEGEFAAIALDNGQRRRRRDRKRRAAARKMKRYKKCVKKKGKEHKKCKRILKRIERKITKADRLNEKLAAKGKITKVGFDKEGKVRSKVGGDWDEGPTTRSKKKGKSIKDKFVEEFAEDGYEDEGFEETAVATTGGGGGSTMLLALGGLVILGGGGFLIYTMTKKPKKRRRKGKRPTGGAPRGRRPIAA